MTAYYNEIDPYAAQWLRNLVSAGHIAPGDVDERSIIDVRPDDLRGYSQCHFFAGIGGWSVALRLSGWDDARPVWTGSCPCQPFSAAGAGKAADDSRHLWPRWFPLIAECMPERIFGEQVEAAIGWGWLDAVFADLESQGYACGASVLPACGVGAPHIRQRLWFVGHANSTGRETFDAQSFRSRARPEQFAQSSLHGSMVNPASEQVGFPRRAREARATAGGLGNPRSPRLQERERDGRLQREALEPSEGQAAVGGSSSYFLGDASRGSGAYRNERDESSGQHVGPIAGATGRNGGGHNSAGDRETAAGNASAFGFWSNCDWLPCTDGKARPVEPGSFPLAHGVQRRASKLRAYGNAIVPQVAAQFIAAVIEASP